MRLRLEQAQRLVAAADDGKPQWNLVFPRGKWFGQNLKPIGGSVDLTDAVFDEMTSNWAKAGKPQLPIYFNHPDDFADSGVSPEELKKAAGWYTDFRKTEAGLEGLVEWTPNGRARIQAREYAFISPEWTKSATDRRTGQSIGWWLYGAALLNDPFFHSQPRVAATAIADSTQPTTDQEQPMSFARIAAALSLIPAASEEQIIDSIEGLKKSTASAGEEATKLRASALKATDDSLKLQARVEELEKLEAANKEALFVRDFEAIFDAGLKAGKKGLPAAKDRLLKAARSLGLDDVKSMIADMADVATAAAGVSGTDDNKGDLAKFEDLVSAKMKASGIKTAEAYRLVTQEHPELAAKVFPSTTSTTPPRA